MEEYQLDCQKLSWIGQVEVAPEPPLPAPEAYSTFSISVSADLAELEDQLPFAETTKGEVEEEGDAEGGGEKANDADGDGLTTTTVKPRYQFVLFNLYWNSNRNEELPDSDSQMALELEHDERRSAQPKPKVKQQTVQVSWDGSYFHLDSLIFAALLERLNLPLPLPD